MVVSRRSPHRLVPVLGKGSNAGSSGSSPSTGFLTLSGNEITDATRRTNTEGDGVSPSDFSTGVWEATTNLVTNGGFETDVSSGGWAAVRGTSARITSDSKFGAACNEFTGNGSGAFNYARQVVTNPAAGTYTYSAYVRAISGDLTKVSIVASNATDGTIVQTVDISVAVADGWLRIEGTGTSVTQEDVNIDVYLNNSADNSGAVFRIDGVQCELQPIATPYVETDGGTAARSEAKVQIPTTGILSGTQSWTAFRVKMGTNSTEAQDRFLFEWQAAADNLIRNQWSQAGDTWGVRRTNPTNSTIQAQTGTDSFSPDDLRTLIFGVTATDHYVGVDGGDLNRGGVPFALTVENATADLVFSSQAANIGMDATIDWFVCGLGNLTDADSANIDFLLSNNSTGLVPSDFPGDCTAVWDGATGVFLKAA